MKLVLYKRGYCLHHDSPTFGFSGGGRRGCLTGKASPASFRRLRTWCVLHDIPSSDCWGVTLTVPGLDLISAQDFKSIRHKLCVWCNYNKVPWVWRVELQQRGQPHIHSVLFGSSDDAMNLCCHWYKLLSELSVWTVERVGESCNDLVEVNRAFVNGACHAIDLQHLTGDLRAWRYLVAHMSKGKQAQLGWAGRNWGVVNKSMFEDVPGLDLELTPKQFYSVRRWVRRLTRVRTFRGRAFFVGNPETIRAMVAFVRKSV